MERRSAGTGGGGAVVFPAEFSDSEVTHTSQEHLPQQHPVENKEELIDLLSSRLLTPAHRAVWSPNMIRSCKEVT